MKVTYDRVYTEGKITNIILHLVPETPEDQESIKVIPWFITQATKEYKDGKLLWMDIPVSDNYQLVTKHPVPYILAPETSLPQTYKQKGKIVGNKKTIVVNSAEEYKKLNDALEQLRCIVWGDFALRLEI